MASIIGFIIVLSILVFVHEFGHFLACRLCGVRVLTFSIGFGRGICSWTDKHGTKWQIGWLPLGGFVAPMGQDMMFKRDEYKKLPAAKKVGHYLSVAPWKQAIIMAGGVFMNFVLAFVLFWGLFTFTPRTILPPVIGGVVENSVAAQAGVIAGDKIISIDGNATDGWTDVLVQKAKSTRANSFVVIDRGATQISMELPAGTWGIYPDTANATVIKLSPIGAFAAAGGEVWFQAKMLCTVLWQIVTGNRSGTEIGGILSIGAESGRALTAGFIAVIALVASLSVSLGVINLVPLPVLDGGYLLILLIETIIRRKLSGRAMNIVMNIGFVLLCALILFTIKNDITRIWG